MRVFGGSSLKDTSCWAISAIVLTLNVPVLRMTIWIILMSTFILSTVSLKSLFKWFVDDVDVVYVLLRVPINGVFALDEF